MSEIQVVSHKAEAKSRDKRSQDETNIKTKRSIELIKPGVRHSWGQGGCPCAIYINSIEADLLYSNKYP